MSAKRKHQTQQITKLVHLRQQQVFLLVLSFVLYFIGRLYIHLKSELLNQGD